MLQNISHVNCSLMLSCCVGIILCAYSYLVELRVEEDKDYVAMCDISEHMSCTKAFNSKYGKGFGILDKFVTEGSFLLQPNSLYGVFFYIFLAALSNFNTFTVARLQVGLSFLSNLGSIYLACVLIFILHDFCIVCVSTYIVNAANLILSLVKLKVLKTYHMKVE